jgi:hypothetical protein
MSAPARAHLLPPLLLLLLLGGVGIAPAAAAASGWASRLLAARRDETTQQALAALTTAFTAMHDWRRRNGAAATSSDSADAAAGADGDAATVADLLAEGLSGGGLGSLLKNGASGSLRLDLGDLLGQKNGGGGLGGGLGGGVAARLQRLRAAMGAEPSRLQAFFDELKYAAASYKLNEGRPRLDRAAERLRRAAQLYRTRSPDGAGCGAYKFTPGGKDLPFTWQGPSLTLTQTTGSCAVLGELVGAGDPEWVGLQRRLACLGPSTQYLLSPITVLGAAVSGDVFACEKCAVFRRFGAGVRVKLTSNGAPPRVFPSRAAFHAALLTNATFDLFTDGLKTAVLDVQDRLTSGQGLSAEAAAALAASGLTGAGLSQTLSELLAKSSGGGGAAGGGQPPEATAFGGADAAAAEGSGGDGTAAWTRGDDGTFDAAAYFAALQARVAKGDFVFRGDPIDDS